jgi:anti-sigma factor RsiW
MTPQPITRFGDPSRNHLTEEQFGELLARSASTEPSPEIAAAEAHLATCEQCAAQLASLDESLSFFRKATSVYADNQLRSMPKRPVPIRRPVLQPAYWAAAAALLLAAILPMQMLHRHSAPPAPAVATVVDHPVESDEALLESVNSEISASVPSPMQTLVDPTTDGTTSSRTSTQRKD